MVDQSVAPASGAVAAQRRNEVFNLGDRVVDKGGDHGIVVDFVPMSMAAEPTMLVAYRSVDSRLTSDVRRQTANDITLEERAYYAAPESAMVEITPPMADRLSEIGEVLERLDHAPQQAAALGLSADAVDAFEDLLTSAGLDRPASIEPPATTISDGAKITKDSLSVGDRITSRSGKWGIVSRVDLDNDIIVTGGNTTLIKLPNIVKVEHPTYGLPEIAPAPRVIVEVSGGLVDAVYSVSPLDVEILDHDNWECVSSETGEHDGRCEDHNEAELANYKALQHEVARLDDRTVTPGFEKPEPVEPATEPWTAEYDRATGDTDPAARTEPRDLRTGERVTGTVLESSIDGHMLYLDAGRGKVVSIHADYLNPAVIFPSPGDLVTAQREGNTITLLARDGADRDRGDD
jgi:preprotein translocase subunit YajC